MRDYQMVTRGRGSLGKLKELADKLQAHKPLVVGLEPLTGVLLKKNPWLLTAPVFSAFHANPDLKDAEKGLLIWKKEECDSLISIGGGSSIDTAKAIKALLNSESTEEAASNHYSFSQNCVHIAIPGTAGTGSEATQFAVVYADGMKVSLNHPELRPDGVLLDASLLESLPVYHKKSCALDALSQGIESYWSRGSNNDSRVHAYLAVKGVLDNLKAYLEGDPHAAEEMMDASYQSGKAIQITRTTAAHAMSYMLTKRMGIAHGHACMITLPVLWEMMLEREEMQDTLGELTAIMQLGDARMVPKLLKGIMMDLEMNIPEMPDENMIEELAKSVNTERLNNHPVKMSHEDVKRAYRLAMMPMAENEKLVCRDLWKYYGRG